MFSCVLQIMSNYPQKKNVQKKITRILHKIKKQKTNKKHHDNGNVQENIYIQEAPKLREIFLFMYSQARAGPYIHLKILLNSKENEIVTF